MRVSLRVLSIALTLWASTAWAQTNRREPHLGYVCPAGGQQGTTVSITVGGQFLRGVSAIHVSGEGVASTDVRYLGRFPRLNGEQRRELQRRLAEIRDERGGDSPGGDRDPMRRGRRPDAGGRDRPQGKKGDDTKKDAGVKLPDHPLIRNLRDLGPREMEMVIYEFLRLDRRKQLNNQIGEMVLIEVAIDPDAAPGDRELRLKTPRGLTNPLCFQVGLSPEIRESAPYDPRPEEAPPVDLPIVLNGQIKPGDVDRFSFRAEQGQRLVIETHARHLVPYLPDAVPGWFQATLALYDAEDKELAFVDDYRFGPDPVLYHEVQETGQYRIEIRDSIYRGREDFVYRITVAEKPFIRSIFPLGGRAGTETVASIDGWNLGTKQLPLDTRPGAGRFREAAVREDEGISNTVAYAVDTLPEHEEAEPNDTIQDAQRVEMPGIINGRIGAPGDEDVFRIEGRARDELVVEVLGRRLWSPVDSLLRLTDASGKLLAWNDDHQDKDGHLHRGRGLITHHADSYLRYRLPEDGAYFVQLADSQSHGGEAHGYRLRIGPARPDFALRVTPSSLNLRAGRSSVITVHALRKDGFDGDITVTLKGAPEGFRLQGGRIPGGRNRVRMTLTAPQRPRARPVSLHLEGSAQIRGREVRRRAIPAEEMMQAFLFRHLVPSRELVAVVLGPGVRFPPPRRAGEAPVRIPAGGTAEVRFAIRRRINPDEIEWQLSDPPEGMTIQDVTFSPGTLSLVLKADGDAMQPGFADNLIVEAFTEREVRRRDGTSTGRRQRFSLGILPAIPFVVVPP